MRIHAVNTQTIYHQIAAARMAHSDAQQALKLMRARAEQDVISALNGSYGKNAEERERQLLLGLADHPTYQTALREARAAERALLMLEADLEVYKDARRQEEWSIRAGLARAIGARAPGADEGDHGVDDVADEEGVSDLVSDYQRQRQIGEERSRIYAEMAELYN